MHPEKHHSISQQGSSMYRLPKFCLRVVNVPGQYRAPHGPLFGEMELTEEVAVFREEKI